MRKALRCFQTIGLKSGKMRRADMPRFIWGSLPLFIWVSENSVFTKVDSLIQG